MLLMLIGGHSCNLCFPRHVWESLGDTTKSSAMIQFINIINSVCPLFASVVEAHKIEKDEKERQVSVDFVDFLEKYKYHISYVIII